MTVVIGTAGHIDHGKTSLLQALTGIDADRLPEERRRGMTIDVGYAHMRLPDGDELDFVDVPGHDRLVGNMLVGAGEIDAALLVVAADDGPRAQTLEHLELLDGLGIDIGVVAVTKIDMVDGGRVEDVVVAARDLVARTTLAGSPVVAVSSTRGDGLADLLVALTVVRDRAAGRWVGGPPRLAIDRVFTVRGRGLVVTGTLRGGPLSRGDTLTAEPGVRVIRVREVQVHNSAVPSVGRGGRVALNVVGAGDPPPRRGDALTTDPTVAATTDVLVAIRRPARLVDHGGSTTWPPAPGSVARLHVGTAQVDARFGRGPRAAAELADGRWVVRLRLGEQIAVAGADRFVLRRSSPARVVAGGTVLDARPPVRASRRRITGPLLVRLGEAAPGASADAALAELHGVVRERGRAHPGASVIAGWVVASDIEAVLTAAALDAVGRSSGIHHLQLRSDIGRRLYRLATIESGQAAAIAGALVDRLIADGDVTRDGAILRGRGVAPVVPAPGIVAAMDRLVSALDVAAPPPLTTAATAVGCPAEGIRALLVDGRIVRLEPNLAYAATAFARIEAEAIRLARVKPLAPADLRDATGTSRKYVMAILEELDRRGVLRRTPDGHVPGPGAPR